MIQQLTKRELQFLGLKVVGCPWCDGLRVEWTKMARAQAWASDESGTVSVYGRRGGYLIRVGGAKGVLGAWYRPSCFRDLQQTVTVAQKIYKGVSEF